MAGVGFNLRLKDLLGPATRVKKKEEGVGPAGKLLEGALGVADARPKLLVLAVPVSGGSYLRLIDSCITQLKAQGPSRTCNESKEAPRVYCRSESTRPPSMCVSVNGRISSRHLIYVASRPSI